MTTTAHSRDAAIALILAFVTALAAIWLACAPKPLPTLSLRDTDAALSLMTE